MTNIYVVREIGGKNLGCFALQDINKGSTILKEKSQLQVLGLSNQITPFLVLGLKEAFNKMTKTDQQEFMKLHDKYDDLSSLPPELKLMLQLKSALLSKITKSDEKLEKIFKIYETNAFDSGVGIKRSRFNHSCKPNAASAKVDDGPDSGHSLIVAVSNIKAGDEITVSYEGRFHGLLKKKTRQEALTKHHHFVCSCHFCQIEEDDDYTFEVLITEIDGLNEEKRVANQAFGQLSAMSYPPSKSRREVECYKELYMKGKAKKVSTIMMFRIIDAGFDAATQGYMINMTEQFKTEAENFAKTADKFEAKLGSAIVTRGIPDYWKVKYQNFTDWLSRYSLGIIDY